MIGRLKKVPLREVWKNEATHFTTWLEENIEQLSESLGFEITVKEREQQVGSFSLDILGETEGETLVVIENQLAKTDHTHLGQLLTYLTNLDAKIAVWITSEARQEHINVVNWLNEQTDCQFYLVIVEAIKVDSSNPAPYFNVICRPDEQLKDVGTHKKELSERGKFNIQFWTDLMEKCKGKLNYFTSRKPSKYHFLSGATGRGGFSFVFLATEKFLGIELYIDTGDADRNEKLMKELSKRKDKIEKEYGHQLLWDFIENKRACRVRHIIQEVNVTKADKAASIEILISHMEKFDTVIRPEIKKLNEEQKAA